MAVISRRSKFHRIEYSNVNKSKYIKMCAPKQNTNILLSFHTILHVIVIGCGGVSLAIVDHNTAAVTKYCHRCHFS